MKFNKNCYIHNTANSIRTELTIPNFAVHIIEILSPGQQDTITGIINNVYLDWTASVETGTVNREDKLDV